MRRLSSEVDHAAGSTLHPEHAAAGRAVRTPGSGPDARAPGGEDEGETWAEVAGKGTAGVSEGVAKAARPAKAVPARYGREFTVRAPAQTAEQAGMTAKEIVQAIQVATKKRDAVAARPSPER